MRYAETFAIRVPVGSHEAETGGRIGSVRALHGTSASGASEPGPVQEGEHFPKLLE